MSPGKKAVNRAVTSLRYSRVSFQCRRALLPTLRERCALPLYASTRGVVCLSRRPEANRSWNVSAGLRSCFESGFIEAFALSWIIKAGWALPVCFIDCFVCLIVGSRYGV